MDDRGEGHYRLVAARDFQIVNGGQTTASLYHALKKEKADISHVAVQVKLTVATEQVKLAELVPLISLYANSQNKVNTADFSANEPFHQKLEELSRTIWAPARVGWSAGRAGITNAPAARISTTRRGRATPARMRDWERQHPLAQKFTKTDLAKFENTWDEQPHLVSRGAEKNFTEWTLARRDEGWPVADDAFFRRLVAKALLFRRSEQIVSAQEYPGYRAQIVTYSIAWLSRRSTRRIDLDRIWSSQALPTKLSQAIDAVAHAARKHIINPPGGRNITEWCKNEECWLVFRDQQIGLPRSWESEWAAEAFVTMASDGDSLAARWEKVRDALYRRLTLRRRVGASARSEMARFTMDTRNIGIRHVAVGPAANETGIWSRQAAWTHRDHGGRPRWRVSCHGRCIHTREAVCSHVTHSRQRKSRHGVAHDRALSCLRN